MEERIKAKKIKEKKDYQDSSMVKQKINNFLLNYFSWIILAILLIILAMGFSMIIKPKYELISKDLELFKRDKEGEYLIHEVYLNKLKDLRKIYESISSEDKRKMDIILPEEVNSEELFSRMETLINQSNFILTSLQISPKEVAVDRLKEGLINSKSKGKSESKDTDEKDETNINELIKEEVAGININMNIIGTDYNGLKELLYLIESNLRLMDIEQISWSPISNSTHLKLVIYYLKKS